MEKSIREVYDLFKELSTLVKQQGETINNIAHLVEDAGIKVEGATEDLKTALVYQKDTRKMKLKCYGSILLVVIAIIAIIVVLDILEKL